MTHFVRFTKSSSDWCKDELLEHNMTITSVPPNQFFHAGANPSISHLDPAILTAPPSADDPNLPDDVTDYLAYLDLATQGKFIVDFAVETLKLLRFNERNTVISTQLNDIPLTMRGHSSSTSRVDACLLHRPTLALLVLVQDKTLVTEKMADAGPQVVAEAIAAFQANNVIRENNGLPCLDAMTIPCITMSGTRPTFYLVPVTQGLSDAVTIGQYALRTVVLKCVTAAPYTNRASQGMEDPEYRKIALQRFLAFKTLAKSHWDRVLDGFWLNSHARSASEPRAAMVNLM